MSIFERPLHADMDLLMKLINELDGEAERDVGIDTMLADLPVHAQSIGHLASQRALRALGITTMKGVMDRRVEFVRLASVYHEAFIIGTWYERRRPQ